MQCNENWEQIGDYVDGNLDPSGVTALELHLAVCARCRSIIADLRALRMVTLALEPQSPPAHLWLKLSRTIEAEPRSPAWRAWFSEGFFTWQPIASLAVLVLLVFGLSFVGGRLSPVALPENQTALVTTAPVAVDGSVDEEFRLAEEQYVTAIASLEEIARSEATSLDEQTAEQLRDSVQVIDEAIGESRAALESEPTNQLAQESLFIALQSKIALLEDTVALIHEMRQDEQDATTGVGPELNQ